MVALSLLVACSKDAAECKAGFTLGEDGLCYQDPASTPTGDDDDDDAVVDTAIDTGDEPAGITLDDLLAQLPPCTATAGDGALDLAAGCADGVCAGATYDEFVAALGPPDSCEPYVFVFGYSFEIHEVDCEWSLGLGAQFEDVDEDGVADPGVATFALYLDLPYAGTTPEGHGLLSEMSCFLEDADPDYASYEDVDGKWRLSYLSFADFSVFDYYGPGYLDFEPDGFADSISLYDL